MIDSSSIVVSSRIRIARNVKGLLFPSRLESSDGLALVQKVAQCVATLGKYKIYLFSALAPEDAEVMFEKHLISHEAMTNTESGAAIVREDECVSIMVNEEDHIRAQCILRGFALDDAYSIINDIDDEIGENIDFAFSKDWGFLTSCVTNLGTGLRASVMLFLPALSLSKRIGKIISSVKSKGLTVRGELGEGSAPLGYLYQISNALSLGITEKETVTAVATAVRRIVELEREERRKMSSSIEISDMCLRAFGILSCAKLLSWNDFMELSGQVKLGLALNFLSFRDEYILDKISDCMSDAGVVKMAGRPLSTRDIEIFRADYVTKMLKNIRINN